MKLRDKRGWKVKLAKGKVMKNMINVIRKTSILNTIKFRKL